MGERQAFYTLEPPAPLSLASEGLSIAKNTAPAPPIFDVPGSFVPSLKRGYHRGLKAFYSTAEALGLDDERIETEERHKEIVKYRNIPFAEGNTRSEWEQENYIHDYQALLEGLNRRDTSISRDLAEFSADLISGFMHPTILASMAATAGIGVAANAIRGTALSGLSVLGRVTSLNRMQPGHIKTFLRGAELGAVESLAFTPIDIYLEERGNQREFGLIEAGMSILIGGVASGVINTGLKAKYNRLMNSLTPDDRRVVLEAYEQGIVADPEEILDVYRKTIEVMESNPTTKVPSEDTATPRVEPESTTVQRVRRESERLFDEQGRIPGGVKRAAADFRLRDVEATRYRGMVMQFDNDLERAMFMVGRGDHGDTLDKIVDMLRKTGGIPADTPEIRANIIKTAKEFAEKSERIADATHIFPAETNIFDALTAPIRGDQNPPNILSQPVKRNGIAVTFENDIMKAAYLLADADDQLIPQGGVIDIKKTRDELAQWLRRVLGKENIKVSKKDLSDLGERVQSAAVNDVSLGIDTKVRIEDIGQAHLNLRSEESIQVRGLRGDLDLQEVMTIRFSEMPPLSKPKDGTGPSPEVIEPMDNAVSGGKHAETSVQSEAKFIDDLQDSIENNPHLDDAAKAEISESDSAFVTWRKAMKDCF